MEKSMTKEKESNKKLAALYSSTEEEEEKEDAEGKQTPSKKMKKRQEQTKKAKKTESAKKIHKKMAMKLATDKQPMLRACKISFVKIRHIYFRDKYQVHLLTGKNSCMNNSYGETTRNTNMVYDIILC